MLFFQNMKYLSKVTLQVRKPDEKNYRKRTYCEKRAWVFSSWKASVSVEAALSLSLFVFAMVCMMIPFSMMERQRQVQAALESANQQLCQYAYLEYQMGKGEELPKDGEEWKQELAWNLLHRGAKAGGQAMAEGMFPKEGMSRRSFSGSSYLEDEETIVLAMDYQMRMPFSILHLDSIPFSSKSARRAWIGRDGLADEGGGEGKEDEDPIVYIGKTSTRYHKSRSCHYLSNQLRTVDYELVASLRNQGGGKYYPCAVCGLGAGPGSRVYIMESGNRYHGDRQCSSIIAYVQAVRLSEVEHMGGCSYCCH